jgi:hypothetical protein
VTAGVVAMVGSDKVGLTWIGWVQGVCNHTSAPHPGQEVNGSPVKCK